MLRRFLRHPLLTLAGNALTIWSVAVFLVTAGIVGGVLWSFSSFPLFFQVLTLAGVLGLCVLTLVLIAPLIRPFLSGIHLSLRASVIAVERERMKEEGVWGVKVAHKASASFATVLVMNTLESGGSRTVARGVTPQVEIFEHDGTRLFNHVGWDIGAERDFRPTHEEHRLYIAGKWKDEEDFFAVAGHLPDDGVGYRPMVGQTYDVKVTLRGDNLRQPISADFLLSNRGAGQHLSMSRVASQASSPGSLGRCRALLDRTRRIRRPTPVSCV
jgi:hypothetical protein